MTQAKKSFIQEILAGKEWDVMFRSTNEIEEMTEILFLLEKWQDKGFLRGFSRKLKSFWKRHWEYQNAENRTDKDVEDYWSLYNEAFNVAKETANKNSCVLYQSPNAIENVFLMTKEYYDREGVDALPY